MKKTTAEKVIAQPSTVSRPKTLTGKVVSVAMKDTIVVLVDRYVKNEKYQKFLTISKKYKAHDAGNTKKMGETVTIVETRPISKDKHFKVV
ncbi:MAG TPA: 30S ribosomal protein S17 [Candidatus Paceibacterota bacterium]|jgi:small subunit ribosomal protein S17|nr:30S ribosomal protein S17 [Candidatus Paceibacterota bacterium]